MGNISRKSKKKLIQKMKATYHEIQLIKIMYTEEALPRLATGKVAKHRLVVEAKQALGLA